MAPITVRNTILALSALICLYLVSWRIDILFPCYSDTNISADSLLPLMIAEALGSYGQTDVHPHPYSSSSSSKGSTTMSSAEISFSQAFSLDKPDPYHFSALRTQCDRTVWRDEGGEEKTIYLECEVISADLTSVISQVKSCFKMAIEAGVGLVLPSIPLRHKDDLVVYNQGNSTAERQFEEWFDQKHAVSSMGQTCPQLKVIAQEDLQAGDRDSMRRVENRWSLDVHSTRFFRERNGHFWAGKPFKAFFEEGLAQLREKKHSGKKHVKDKSMTIQKHLENEAETAEEASTTVTIVGMRADLELFNIANDPTGHDRHLWDDLGKALRFLEAPRAIVDRLLRQIGDERFFAVGFRGESNNMPESIKQQISENFDALDRAWESYRAMPEMAAYDSDKRPLVYLACGDEGQAQAFAEEGRGRGWNVTHKYALAEAMSNDGAVENISALPFDFEAIVDLGMLVKSYFFVGLMSSAFSYTVANMRDPTTRYRGSSFAMWEDGGARTHLLPNNDIHGETMMEKYACCL